METVLTIQVRNLPHRSQCTKKVISLGFSWKGLRALHECLILKHADETVGRAVGQTTDTADTEIDQVIKAQPTLIGGSGLRP